MQKKISRAGITLDLIQYLEHFNMNTPHSI